MVAVEKCENSAQLKSCGYHFFAMKQKKKIRERRHRLSRDCYRGMIRATFTFCIKDRAPVLNDSKVAAGLTECLRRALKKYQVMNWTYIFMPDHLHCIVEGETEEADLWKAAVLFKQLSGRWLSRNRPGVSWQKDFYDHVHRKDEDLQKHIGYILDNPVRRGLVTEWADYSFMGSLDHKLNEII